MSGPTLTSVRAGGGKRRPELVVAVVIVTFLAAALAKPWESGSGTASPGASLRAAAEPSQQNAQRATDRSASPASTTVRIGVPRLAWATVRELVQPRDAWGIRTILARPNRAPGDRPIAKDEVEIRGWFVSERWRPISLGPSGFDMFDPNPKALSGSVALDTSGLAIAALGVTAPAGETPLDVRVWRYPDRGMPERLLVRELSGSPATVERVLMPSVVSFGRDYWAPGVYGIELLMGWRTAIVRVEIPGERTSSATRVMSAPVDLPVNSSVDQLGAGPFAIDDAGTPRPLFAHGAAVDGAAAWFGGSPPQGDAYARGPVRVLGVALGPGERFISATVQPLVTGLDRRPPSRGEFLHSPYTRESQSSSGEGRPMAYFESAVDGLWPPATYRLDAEWTNGRSWRSRTWLVHLPPKLGEPFAPFLAAARAAAPYAGRNAVIAGPIDETADPKGRVLIPAGARGPAATQPSRERDCPSGVRVASRERVIAFTHDHRVAPSVELTVSRRPGVRAARVPIATATDAIDGVVLLAPLGGSDWLPGRYELTFTYPEPVADPDPAERVSFCVPASAG